MREAQVRGIAAANVARPALAGPAGLALTECGSRNSGAILEERPRHRNPQPSGLAVSGDDERPLFASWPILAPGDRPNRSADRGYRPWSLERPQTGAGRRQSSFGCIGRDAV